MYNLVSLCTYIYICPYIYIYVCFGVVYPTPKLCSEVASGVLKKAFFGKRRNFGKLRMIGFNFSSFVPSSRCIWWHVDISRNAPWAWILNDCVCFFPFHMSGIWYESPKIRFLEFSLQWMSGHFCSTAEIQSWNIEEASIVYIFCISYDMQLPQCFIISCDYFHHQKSRFWCRWDMFVWCTESCTNLTLSVWAIPTPGSGKQHNDNTLHCYIPGVFVIRCNVYKCIYIYICFICLWCI